MSSFWNGESGLWTTATLWSAGIPTSLTDAVFGGTSADSVTFATTATVAGVLATDSLATFDMADGLLAAGSWDWAGAFTQTGGTLSLAGDNPLFAAATQTGGTLILSASAGYEASFAALRQTGGLIEITAGTLAVRGSALLGGALEGAGTLQVGGNETATIAAGATIAVRHLAVAAGGVLAFGTNAPAFTLTGDVDLAAGAALTAPNGIVSLAAGGAGTLAGGVTVGQLAIAGAYDLGGLSLAGPSSVLVTGPAALGANPATLGSSGSVTIAAGAALTLLDPGTLAGSGASSVTIAGLLDEAESGTFVIAVPSLALGGVAALSGALDLTGGQALLAGSLSGPGTLSLGAGETGLLAGQLDEAGLAIAAGGTLDVTRPDLFGGNLSAAGLIETATIFTLAEASTGTLAGALIGGGTLAIAGSLVLAADVLGATLLVTGEAACAPGATVGAGGLLTIAATGTLDVTGAGTLAALSLVNAGLLVGSAAAAIDGDLTTTGTLDIAAGALTLGGSAMLGGLIEGAGTLAVAGLARLAPQALVQAAHLALAGGTIALGENLALYGTLSGAGTIDTGGFALNLQTGQLAGLVTGGGTLQTAGPVDEGPGAAITLQGNGTTLLDSAMFTADGAGLVLGGAADHTTLAVAAGATFAITAAAAITSGETAAILTNAGMLTAALADPLGAGATIAIATLINTGTIADATGALTIAAALLNNGLVDAGGALTVTGPVEGAGRGFLIDTGAMLQLGGAVGTGQAVDFFGPGGTLVLGDAAGFAGTIENFAPGDAIDLAGLAAAGLTYAGSTLTLLGVTAGVTAALATLDLPGLIGPDVALVSDGAGGTMLLYETNGHQNAPPGTSVSAATWNQPETGSAANPANWLSGATPGSGALLVFPSSANPYEAVFDETFAAYGLAAAAGATLALTGGSLAATNTLTAGTLILAAGTLDAVANPAGNSIAALSLAAAGALQADAGALTIGNGLGTLAGTLEGGGAIVLAGTEILGGGADLLAATLALTGTTSLAGNLIDVIGAAFINTGSFALGTYNLLLGLLTADDLAGRITGQGTITVGGVGDLDGLLGATLLDLGVLQGAGPESLTGAIDIAAGALLADPVITGGAGTLANAGTLIAAETSSLSLAQFTNSGIITIGAGTLALAAGNAVIGGLVAGAGALAITGGSTTLAPGATLSVAALDLAAGATLSVASSLALAAPLIDTGGLLAAGALTLTGTGNMLAGTFDGALSLGGGTLAGLTLTGTGTSINLGGSAQLTGLSLAAGTALSLAPGAVLALAGPVGGAGTLSNAGVLTASAITPVSLSPGAFINTGLLAIGSNETVTLATGGTLAGTIGGGGTLIVQAASPLTLAAGLSLAGHALTLAAGSFALGGAQTIAGQFALGGATLGLAGQWLDLLGGSTLAGTFADTGTVALGGAASAGDVTFAGTALVLDITGALTADGALSTGGLIDIAAGGTLALAASAPLGGPAATLINDGLLEKRADGQVSVLTAATFVNNGTVAASFGTIAIAGTLINDGTLVEAGLGAVSAGALAGSGGVAIGPSGLTVSGAVAAGQTIAFTGAGGTLTLNDPGDFAGTIAGTLNGDVIDLPSLAPASLTGETLAGGVLTLTNGTGALTFALGSSAGFNQPLIIGTDGGAGTDVTMACFVTGTRIATPAGPRKVEELQPGDMVHTAGAGGPAAIVWTGRRRLTFGRAPHAARPIRILAGAFAPGLPARDLRLSPQHAIAVQGVLIEAAALVNGATIRRERETPAVTYHHLELARHSLLLAEDLPVESYRDTGNRGEFADMAGTEALPQPPCAPLCRGGAGLAAARAALLARASALGFTRTRRPHLTARAGARRLSPLPHPHAWHFALPAALPRIELLSPAACPAELAAAPADPRQLGAALASVTLQTPHGPLPIDLADARHAGLYEAEPGFCWTNGHALLALPPYSGPALLAVRLAGAAERWEGP